MSSHATQDSLLEIKEEVLSGSMVVKEGGETSQVPDLKSSTKRAPQPSKSVERSSRAPKTQEEISQGAAMEDQVGAPTPFEEELPEEGEKLKKQGGVPKSAESTEKKRKAARNKDLLSEAGGENREDLSGAPTGGELSEEPKEVVGETGGSGSSQAVEKREQASQTADSSERGGLRRPRKDALQKERENEESVGKKNSKRSAGASEASSQPVEKKRRADARKGGVEVAEEDQGQTTKGKIDPSSSALLNKAVLKRHLRTEFPGVRFSADFFPALGHFVKESIIKKMQEASAVEKKAVTDRDVLEREAPEGSSPPLDPALASLLNKGAVRKLIKSMAADRKISASVLPAVSKAFVVDQVKKLTEKLKPEGNGPQRKTLFARDFDQ